MSLNNPAGRLLFLLEEGRQNLKGSVKEVLASLLHVSDKSESEKFSRISYLLILPFQIREYVEKIDVLDPELILPSVQRIETFFGNLNLQQNWSGFRAQFNAIIMKDLATTDSILSKILSEPKFNDSKKQYFLKKLDELYQEVENADYNDEVKEFLLVQIEQLIIAIESYSITGEKPILDNINRTIGSIVINPNKVSSIDKESSFWKKFVGTFFALLTLVGGANDIKELPKNYPDLLPAIEEVIDEILSFDSDNKEN